MATQKQSIKKVDGAAIAAGIYKATFSNGTVVECNLSDVPEAMVARFTQYGLKQKCDDSMAGAEDVEEAIEELKATWDSIVKGQWTMRVAGEGVEGGLFARAYSQRHGLSLADAKAKISGLVERNLGLNRAKAKDAEAAEKITERVVFNALRDAALDRDQELAGIYADLKAKKAGKVKAKAQIEIEV